jgi:hypothetical protein
MIVHLIQARYFRSSYDARRWLSRISKRIRKRLRNYGINSIVSSHNPISILAFEVVVYQSLRIAMSTESADGSYAQLLTIPAIRVRELRLKSPIQSKGSSCRNHGTMSTWKTRGVTYRVDIKSSSSRQIQILSLALRNKYKSCVHYVKRLGLQAPWHIRASR